MKQIKLLVLITYGRKCARLAERLRGLATKLDTKAQQLSERVVRIMTS